MSVRVLTFVAGGLVWEEQTGCVRVRCIWAEAAWRWTTFHCQHWSSWYGEKRWCLAVFCLHLWGSWMGEYPSEPLLSLNESYHSRFPFFPLIPASVWRLLCYSSWLHARLPILFPARDCQHFWSTLSRQSDWAFWTGTPAHQGCENIWYHGTSQKQVITE